MATAKDIVLRPIDARQANELVRRVHYSGKVVQNSQLHVGVFLDGRLEGALQFGPSLDKRKIQGLVDGTGWNEFIELNRMAFTDVLPRNSESRALGVCIRLMKKFLPSIKWVVTFADGTQCGDGTIYRASGFILTGIKKNDQIWASETGSRETRTSLTDGRSKVQQNDALRLTLSRVSATKGKSILTTGAASMQHFKEAGFKCLDGFQLRYIYFIDTSYRKRLTVPELPFSAIEDMGAGMYRGAKISRAGSIESDAPGAHPGEGCANQTPALLRDTTPDDMANVPSNAARSMPTANTITPDLLNAP